MKKLSIFTVVFALVVNAGAFAEESRAVTKAAQLKQQIEKEEAALAELQTALQASWKEGKVFAFKLGWDAGRTMLFGAGATYLARHTLDGTSPLIKFADKIHAMDVKAGLIQGQLPRFVEREAAFYGIHAFNVAVITAGTFYALVNGYRTAVDGIICTIDGANIARLEVAIHIDAQKLAAELADLSSVRE